MTDVTTERDKKALSIGWLLIQSGYRQLKGHGFPEDDVVRKDQS